MNKDSLIMFIKRILENGSPIKSRTSLRQLKNILEMQGASQTMIELVENTIRSIPEAKEAASSNKFDENALMIAIQRAQDRIRREEEMASRGRC